MWSDPEGDFTLHRVFDAESFVLSLAGAGIAEISFDPRKIRLHIFESDGSQETTDHFLHDHVLPRVIAHEGDLVLHGGGVVLDSHAIAITADTGRGKSTLTASLHAAGHGILGDDALVVTSDDNGHRVRAVYPSLRLNPDSAGHLFPGEEGRPMAHYSPKRHLPVGETVEEAPLAALFLLGAPTGDISARRLTPVEACMTIIANSFALDPTDKERAREKLVKATALASRVPMWELRYPRDYARLPDVHRLIHDLLSSPAG